MIPYGKQHINEEDIQAVIAVLRGELITQGEAVPKFEKAIGRRCGVDFALGVNSGTSALHLACLALGLSAGDYFWTVPNTFVATANAARHCGAQVDFVDIDSHTWNMSIIAFLIIITVSFK